MKLVISSRQWLRMELECKYPSVQIETAPCHLLAAEKLHVHAHSLCVLLRGDVFVTKTKLPRREYVRHCIAVMVCEQAPLKFVA